MTTKERFLTFAECEKWVAENKEKVLEYAKKNDIPLQDIKITTHTYNILRINGKRYMSNIIFCSDDEINNFDMVNKLSADEIISLKNDYIRNNIEKMTAFAKKDSGALEPESEDVSVEPEQPHAATAEFSPKPSLGYIKVMLNDKITKQKITEFAKKINIEISDYNISARSYNTLRRSGVRFLCEAIPFYPDGFASFRNMGEKSINEVCEIIENYVGKYYNQITTYIKKDGKLPAENTAKAETNLNLTPFELTIPQLLNHPDYKEKVKEYFAKNDIPIDCVGLSVRAVNAFMRANITSLFGVFFGYPDNLSVLKNVGTKTIKEIKQRIEFYNAKMHDAVSAYCSGDLSVIYPDEFVFDTVMSCFEGIGFKGISFKQIREAFPNDIDDARIKKCIGGLLAKRKLEYVDFRLYRVYPSIYSFLEQVPLCEENKRIITKKLSGMTLESIAREKGVTRERIRQKFNKILKNIREKLYVEYGVSNFDEDYYVYLYSKYECTKELWNDFLNIPKETCFYLYNTQKTGKREIKDAINDPKIDLILKIKIQNYLNRTKILLGDTLVEGNRKDVEDFVLSKIAGDEMHFDEFVRKYNTFLKENNVDDEELYCTEEVRKTRASRLSASMHCLWKNGERLRYYDISVHDYTELFEELDLESFENTAISTLKLFNDHREIMLKYDIRDHYELHNLLKKIVDTNNYKDIRFSKQPMITFGEFDRNKAIYNIISAFSPITIEELTDYLYSEYGYDKATAQATYFAPFADLYHNGVFSADFKQIPTDRIEILRSYLPDEFYFISEIKEIYTSIFKNADAEEINPHSLKAVGYKVYSSYVLKSYATADAYFKDALNSDDVFSSKELNKKYGRLRLYTSMFAEMCKSYDILMFEYGEYINFRKIEKLGITKDDIKNYCDDVYNRVGENQYFTIYSLRELDINTKLNSLGFGEMFFAGILAASNKFLYIRSFDKYIFYKGVSASGISKRSFILSRLSNYRDVDFDQFRDDCFDTFGVKIPDRYELTSAIGGTDFYFDEIMDKFYLNKNIYYSEFED